MAEGQDFQIFDNPTVVETYANKLISASFDGGAVIVTLGTVRVLTKPAENAAKKGAHSTLHVTARVALSLPGAVELANVLSDLLKKVGEMQQRAQAPLNSNLAPS